MIPLGDINPVRRTPWVNVAIILINFIVFIFFEYIHVLQGDFYGFEQVVKNYGVIPYFVLNGHRLYTIFTHMWLHGSWEHIIGNMLFLAIFGDNVESLLGHKRYLLLYLGSGLFAVLFHLTSIVLSPASTLNPYLSHNPWLVPAIGASGAISGVLAAYMLFYPGALVKVLVFFPLPMLFYIRAEYFIGFWFLYQLLMGTYSLTGVPSGVAWWAHVGGFIGGMLLAAKLVDKRQIELHRRFIRMPYYLF